MLNRKVMSFGVLLAAATLVAAKPQDQLGQVLQEASGGLPFLEFKNGGVRVNFGGYHAEAGLGGLLGGSGTAGGLHASAGTPSGAHASAGLGGLLGGDNAGGGLHARAGLGNGGPEAGAGLGGVLDGSAESPAQGGLYAGASPGNFALRKRKIVRTNLQVIPRPEEKEIQKVDEGSSAVGEGAVKSIVKESEKEVHVQPVASAGISGGLYAATDGSTLGKSVEKVKISNGRVHVVQKGVALQPNPVAAQTEVNVNPGTTAEAGGNVVNSQPIPARWYFRKRYRAGPHKKVFYRTQILPEAQPVPAASASGTISASASGQGEVQYSGQKTTTLFDDIFNIPISTLTAVNQLLNNKAG